MKTILALVAVLTLSGALTVPATEAAAYIHTGYGYRYHGHNYRYYNHGRYYNYRHCRYSHVSCRYW